MGKGAREVRMDGVQWGEREEKPQRNKRPSGLIRRQIGCRAQRGESERG